MWTFLTVLIVAVCVTVVILSFLRRGGEWEFEIGNPNTDRRMLDFAECDGSHHGPSSLGGVMHQTCLKTGAGGELTMWCHSHNQNWTLCIEKFGVS